MNGKGSKSRPLSVPYSKYVDNFDEINWSKKQSKKEELPENYNKDKQDSSLLNPEIIKQ